MSEIITAKIKKNNSDWMVDISGEYLLAIRNYLLEDGINEDGVDSIIRNAAKVLGYCPNPNNSIEEQTTGLMIGKVQSGKTSSFISLTAAAFDNQYNIVIILGGTKNDLLQQNKNRIKEYFSNTPAVILSVVEDEDSINEESIQNFIELGKKVVIVALKHQKRIDKMRETLFKSPFINSQPILIIDDEGDEHTPNTLRKKGKESTKYKSIKNLRNACKKAAYISVTATPQANIIIPIFDMLSPDFAVLIEPGEGYCGLDVFHDVNSKYCIEIPEGDSILDNDGIPSSFVDALSMFFVATAIYHYREGKRKKMSMLIHPSRIVSDLSSVKAKTQIKIKEWKDTLMNPKDIEYQILKERLKKSFDYYKNNGVQISDFNELFNSLLYEIRDCGVHLVTGENHLNTQDDNYTNNIYIGGDMVGRGLTFKGLAITYIIRTSKGKSNVDTVQQRARWFGYKMDYLDLCRVFATKKILDDFEEIKKHEEDLWQTIKLHNLNGKSFKEMKRIFILSDKLRPTRSSVGKTYSYDFTLWNCEDKFIENQEFQIRNVEIANKIANDFKHLIRYEEYGNTRNKVIRDLSFDEIVSNYLCNFHTPINAKIDNAFIQKINNIFKMNNVNAKCDIVWPRYDYNNGYQIVQVDTNGKIHNYMVGQNPKGATGDKIVYKGDRYIMRGNVIEIQFHNILNRITNESSLSIALFIPPNYRLNNIIVGE